MPSDFALRMRSHGRRRGRMGGGNGNGNINAVQRRLSHPFWTTPLAADAPLASTSADYVARMAYQRSMTTSSTPVKGVYAGAFTTNTDQGAYSTAIYVLPENTPRVPVWSIDFKYGGWRDVLANGVPIPDPAQMTDGTIAPSGTDGSVIFICGNELWEMWRFQPRTVDTPEGFEWACKQGGYMRNYKTHPGWYAASSFYSGGTGGRPNGFNWGVSASGQSYLGSILTTEDFNAPDITHPLAISLPVTGGTPSRLLPATRFDALTFVGSGNNSADVDALRVPEGAFFRLPVADWSNATIDSYAASVGLAPGTTGRNGSTAEVVAKIMRCLRDYGAFAAESSGVVGFAAEHIKTYDTPYHPTGLTRPSWGNFSQQLPWTSLVQIEAPATSAGDISVPTSAGPEPWSDTFNRPDDTAARNGWYENDSASGAQHPIVSGQVGITATTAATHWLEAPFFSHQGDMFAEQVVSAAPAPTTPHPAVAVRFFDSAISPTAVFGRYSTSAGAWELARLGGANIASIVASAPTLPYTIRVEAQGSTVRLLVNGTQVATGTDPGNVKGGTAIGTRWNTSADETQRVDSFSCGPL